MIKLKNKNRIKLFVLCMFFPFMACAYYFVPFDIVWITGDEALRKELTINLYQQSDLCCGYERQEAYTGNESIFMIRQEYGEHRFLMKYDSYYQVFGFFKFRAWYDMFLRFHFYSSEGKVYCDVYHLMGLDWEKRTICIDGDSGLEKYLDEFVCEN
ncbi:MAG: hypothetical protein MJZ34_13340 [Paludibacteraceae bacterium]|nr:hypothetical protein [Paludibacteraceae bacterium]